MLNYSKIISSLRLLTEDNKDLIDEFENYFRSLISSLDIQLLLDGPIPPKILKNLLTASLQHLSQHIDKHYPNELKYQLISASVWNPLVSSLILSQAEVVHLERVPSQKATIKKAVKTGSISQSFSKLDISEENQSAIRRDLTALSTTVKRPYSNRFHKHVECTTNNCAFCVHMFTNVNITKCVGHKPCHKTGFYPHVGKSLWQMIKRKHAVETCSLVPKECKEGELPAIAAVLSPSPSPLRQYASWADDPVDEIDKEPIYYPSIGKKRRSSTSNDASSSSM